MVSDQKNKKLRFIPWGISLGLCLVGDILSIVFVTWTRDADLNAGTWNYTDWMAYTVFFIFSIIVVSVGNIGNNVKEAVVSNTLLLLFLALMYSSYTILFPGLYNVYVTDIPDIAPYLQIYLFPFFDLIFYSLLLVANAHMSPKAKGFASMFQFLQLGYFIGMNMLVGVTEV